MEIIDNKKSASVQENHSHVENKKKQTTANVKLWKSLKSRQGIGSIEIRQISNKHSNKFSRTEVYNMFQQYPFGFRTPENCCDSVCRWVYPITFGGGLVGGDQIEADYVIGQKCCVLVTTQEITKAYHCLVSEQMTSQIFKYVLEHSCLLCVLPDPLMCYKDSRFQQKQTFHLEGSSNLVFLDWLLAGRLALGETWSFQQYKSTIEIFLSGKLVLRECNNMENKNIVPLSKSMGKYQVLGTCIVLGSYLTQLTQALTEQYSHKKGFGEQPCRDLVVSVSPLSFVAGKDSIEGCYLRFLAVDMKAATSVIDAITTPLLPDFGADPFERKL